LNIRRYLTIYNNAVRAPAADCGNESLGRVASILVDAAKRVKSDNEDVRTHVARIPHSLMWGFSVLYRVLFLVPKLAC
jgi:hypothetical protein